ncbi:LOW QUALITY PROTEIN: sodium channel modifier 1 [Falco peregrinus]|uniref:LOW QUALITY PROTEIN: sodium channel modifier 1 n=1 Tax=Falco peregrinus TaxID=8954 RepID=UPI0006787D20|nr:LOW QUALITY PROTEIN: sodium channel modifier 1 [Falco peregrinus]
MSFKREGDDPGQLGVLQKRRIADLLANYIPEDEALLLRSGRYACTVCAHRPVFDTLDVLTVHRAGKKHMGSLQRFYSRKRSLQDAAQKRRHEEELQAEEAGTQGSPAPLLAQTRRIARNALLKAAPYSSCCRRTGVEGSSSRAGVTQMGLSAAPMLPEPSQKNGAALDASPAALLPGHRSRRVGAPKTAPARTQQGSKGKASSSVPSQAEALSPERRQALERYLQLRSAGWIQDRSGKWVKDENAEFDSDEDEPPALLPA